MQELIVRDEQDGHSGGLSHRSGNFCAVYCDTCGSVSASILYDIAQEFEEDKFQTILRSVFLQWLYVAIRLIWKGTP